MKSYLDRVEKQVQSESAAEGGKLTKDQEETVLQQLTRADSSINQTFCSA